MKTVFLVQGSDWPSNNSELQGVLRAAGTFGWNVRTIKYRNEEDIRKGPVGFLRTFAELSDFWNPIGVIIDKCGGQVSLRRRHFDLPVVFLDQHPSNADADALCVYSDSEAIARLAARELLTIPARTYAYAPFHTRFVWSEERGRAFQNAVELNQAECRRFRPSRVHLKESEYMAELTDWLSRLERPIALFAANDYIAMLVIAAAQKLGLRVPKDLTVLGVDNDESLCLQATPTLSSIKPDHEMAGYMAGLLLHELIGPGRKKATSKVFGPAAVFHRGSTRPLKRHDERTMRIVEIVRKQALRHLSVAQLAREFGISTRLLELHFHEATGHSIREEIRSIRLEKAKLLLLSPGCRMKTVAEQSGYPSLHAFRKTFTTTTGLSPTKWRKSAPRPGTPSPSRCN